MVKKKDSTKLYGTRPRSADKTAEEIGDELRADIRRALVEIETETGYRVHLLCAFFVHPSNPKPPGEEPVCVFGMHTTYSSSLSLYRLVNGIETTLQDRMAAEIAGVLPREPRSC